ncbi:MAG: DUF4097 family beta strand repeat-containing protein [Defluviitaleaceae bacterium]|nr:DUF4097 family beta strand repeat-containing protein [Defluviitaleaceae bacterium]
MTKNEFLSELSHKLRALPESEQRDALEYYEGYISDAHDEADAIAKLGSPGEVVATILSNYVSQRPNTYEPAGSHSPRERRGGLKTAHIALLAIFAVPVGIPLAATAFGLIVGLFAIIFSVVVTGIALLIAGVMTLISAPAAFFNDFWFGVFSAGIGFAALGLGILFFKGSVMLLRGFPAISRLIRRRRDTTESYTPSPLTPTIDPQYANSMPPSAQETHDGDFAVVSTRRRIRPIRIAVLLVLLGASLFGIAWLNGARGGAVFWEDGRLRVVSSGRGGRSLEALDIPTENGLEFHSVNISATTANVTILPTSTQPAVYSGTSNVDIRITDGILTINQRTSGTSIYNLMNIDFSPRSGREIRLYLPTYFLVDGGDIQVRTTSGRIRVEGGFSNLTAQSTSGRIQVRDNNHTAENLSLRTTSGSISVENIRHLNELHAQATSGRISVSNIQSEMDTVNLHTTSGRISAERIPHADRFYVRATSGGISLESIGWTQMEARSVSGRINISRGNIDVDGQVSNTIVSATSGSVTVEVNNNQDDFRLNLSSTSGRMQVNGNNLGNRGQVGSGSGENLMDVRTTSGRVNVNFR